MRLHSLAITAFGPFAETATVDFDALGADGLFLLHGQTGAGKTTVLDAIAFALYGTVPGVRREGKRLRSDHADSTTPPVVELEATIAGRRLRILRSPEFVRPKRNGTGTRSMPATATLTWLDGRGRNLSRIADIGEEVNRLLGMSADQFFQVVLLPQGDFARFLRADNDARESLLEKLFDTERFGTAEGWLADRRRAGATELDERRQGIDRIAAQVCLAADVGAANIPAAPEDQLSWAGALLTEAQRHRDASRTELQHRRAAAESAAAQVAEQRRLAELYLRRAEAQRQLDALRATADDRRALGAELDRARRAGPAATEVEVAIAAQRRSGELAARSSEAATRLSVIEGAAEVVSAVREIDADSAPLDEAIHTWTTELGKLEDLCTMAETVERVEGEGTQCRREYDELMLRTQTIGDARAALPALIAETETALQSAIECSATMPARAAERNRLRTVLRAAEQIRQLRTEAVSAAARFEALRSKHTDARQHELDLREQRLAGMAAELAGQLADGSPCQVCGSTSHPEPATSAGPAVTEAAEAAAGRAERRAAAARDDAADALTDVQRRIDVCVAQGGDRDITDVAADLERAEAELAATALADARVDESAARLSELRGRDQELARKLADLGRRSSALHERMDGLTARITELRERLRVAAGSDGTVRQRHARVSELVTAAAALRETRHAARAAADAARSHAQRAERLLRQAGFADAAAVQAAQRDAGWVQRTADEIAAANDARAHAEAVLAEPDIARLDEREPVDVAAATCRAEEAAQAHTEAVAKHAAAVRCATQLEDLAAQLWAAVDRFVPMRQRQEELAAVAELVAGRGANSRRMSLRSYVLAARLEEVAIAASGRLRGMSGGRYEFVHTDVAGPRGKRGGLGLDVRDDYTGEVRSAKTLSGGETFLASLALALGLADTVAEHCGGRVLDTIFIDEGFGTLDSETLDAVMGVLDELRAGGRVVGIVSHVDEMRQRIPSRLHVIRGRTGSRLQAQAAV